VRPVADVAAVEAGSAPHQQKLARLAAQSLDLEFGGLRSVRRLVLDGLFFHAEYIFFGFLYHFSHLCIEFVHYDICSF
jgi:hypothetical protein